MSHDRTPYELHKHTLELTLAVYRVTDFFSRTEPLRNNLREKANEIFADISELGYHPEGDGSAPLNLYARIETMIGYLRIAQTLYLVRTINVLVLEREYRRLGGRLAMRRPGVPDWQHMAGRENTALPEAFSPDHPPVLAAPAEVPVQWRAFAGVEEHASSESERGEKVNIRSLQHHQTTTPLRDKKESDTQVRQPDVSRVNERQKKIIAHMRTAAHASLGDLLPQFREVSAKTIQRDLQDLIDKHIVRREGEKRGAVYLLS